LSCRQKEKKTKSTDKPPYYREFQNSKILAHLFPQKIPLYDESVTLDFVLSPKKKKKKKTDKPLIIGNFRILRFWRICFHKKIPLYDESATLDFVFSPKKKKKKKKNDKPPYYREFQNSKILAHLFPQKNSFV
jgi:hypothetical protein